MRIRFRLPLVLLIVLGTCFAVGYLSMLRPRAEVTSQPLNAAEFRARFPDLRIPASAQNVLFARSSVGLGGRAMLYRFDAPLSDCVEHAKGLMRTGDRNAADGPDSPPRRLVTLTAPPRRIVPELLAAYGLADVTWFDIEDIRAGLEGTDPSGGLIWVDTIRARVYYCRTD
jgi:hypothetical protein